MRTSSLCADGPLKAERERSDQNHLNEAAFDFVLVHGCWRSPDLSFDTGPRGTSRRYEKKVYWQINV